MSDGAAERERELRDAYTLVEEFLAFLFDVRRLSPHSVRGYETDLRAFLGWCENQGLTPLRVTRRHMRGYLAYMKAAGYADKTFNRRVSSLRTFYAWLEREGKASAEPVSSLKSRKLTKSLPKTMTDADMVRLIDACDRSTPEGMRDLAFLELVYATGARISEIAGLVPKDIDFEQGQVRLFGKRSKERIVPLYDQALETLSVYLSKARPQLVAMRKSDHEAEALFVSTRGNNMSAEALRRRFVEYKTRANIDVSVTPHTVRHTFATELLNGGADLQAVQELLGHESLATTQIYTHLSIDRLKQATRQAHPRG